MKRLMMVLILLSLSACATRSVGSHDGLSQQDEPSTVRKVASGFFGAIGRMAGGFSHGYSANSANQPAPTRCYGSTAAGSSYYNCY